MNDPYRPPAEMSLVDGFSDDVPTAAMQGASPHILALKILRKHFFVLLLCSLAIWLPLNLALSYLDQYFVDEDDLRTSLRMQQLFSWWFGILSTGAILSAVAGAYRGQTPTWGRSMAAGVRCWPRLWTTYFLYWTIGAFGLIAFIFPGIYFWVRAVYCDAIAVNEAVHGPTAVQRSFQITKGRFGDTFVVALVITGVYLVSAIAFTAILVAIVLLADPSFVESPSWYWIVEAFVVSLFSIATVYAQTFVFCWYQRMRIQLGAIANQASGHAGGTDPLLDQLPDDMGQSPDPPREPMRW
ncbi:MAG: hypothetical protein HKN47_23275 [Pirellulaceae bacterium]|nr:hypothetical protein [Pirellulaceae bacterium]